jgi:hypothetical protein
LRIADSQRRVSIASQADRPPVALQDLKSEIQDSQSEIQDSQSQTHDSRSAIDDSQFEIDDSQSRSDNAQSTTQSSDREPQNPQSEIRNSQPLRACVPELVPSAGEGCPRAFLNPFHAYCEIFGDRLYLAAELAYDLPDEARLAQLVELSQRTGIPLVAANNVHYHVPERRYLQDVLTCIREQCTLAEAGSRLFANAERHLRPLDEIARRYAAVPEALARTVEIAERCTFGLDELRYEYPHEGVSGAADVGRGGGKIRARRHEGTKARRAEWDG